jgi:hypothetical protein
MTETIGIVTTCHTYEQFIPDWSASVAELNRKPDEVVIACTRPVNVIEHLDPRLTNTTIVRVPEPFGLGKYLNAAVQSLTTDWVAWIGADDRYRPHALDDLLLESSDVIGFGMQWPTGATTIPSQGSMTNILSVSSNPVLCGSLFRRSLWEKHPFNPDLHPFEDWGFWVGCAAQGARFTATNRVDFDYSTHAAQNHPPQEPTRTRIREWLNSLEGNNGDH